MMEVTLYGLHGCPMCKYLEQVLNKKGMPYTKVDDLETIKALDLHSVPMLEVDGERMDYPTALKYVKDYKAVADTCSACTVGG